MLRAAAASTSTPSTSATTTNLASESDVGFERFLKSRAVLFREVRLILFPIEAKGESLGVGRLVMSSRIATVFAMPQS
jgi:hypothetical protein